MDEPLLRLELTGHPAVRATHAKTLEFAADTDITERATCVVGVGAQALPALDVSVAVAGPVRITITAGGSTAAVVAIANPDWRPGGAAVVRRSSDRPADTLATDADLAAADLPRELVRAAADPATTIAVRVDRLALRPDGRAGLVLAWASPTAPAGTRLVAEVAAADAVVAEDAGAVRLLAGLDVVGSAPAHAVGGLLDGSLGRVLSVATAGIPGGAVTEALAAPDRVAVEVAGLPAQVAAAAATPRRGPVELAGTVAKGRIEDVLRSAPPSSALAVTVAVADLPRLLELAADRRGSGVLLDPAAGGQATWGPLGQLRARRTSGSIVCVLDGAEPAGLDGELAAFARALLAEGVSARTVAMALAQLPGWSRRRGYDTAHALLPEEG